MAAQPAHFEQYWTTKEVAARLRVSHDCVRRWLSKELLAKTKAAGRTLVSETQLQDFLRRSTENDAAGTGTGSGS